jgi:3-hydroxymyristoyl/3-hydroxydecanoyl-(acyl carrier protein) dehydratase
MAHERTVSIGHDHPSLAGHFPGHPIVPGVVLLGEVIETLRRSSAALSVTGLPMVKFSSPLKPGEAVTIHVDQDEAALASFSCRVGTRLIASGVIELASGAVAHMEGA